MEKVGKIQLWSLDEIIDEEIGVLGTAKREVFEQELQERIDAEQEKVSFHLTMPRSLKENLSKRASALGQSMSEYVNNVIQRDFALG